MSDSAPKINSECDEWHRIQNVVSQCVESNSPNPIASRCGAGQNDCYVIAPVIQFATTPIPDEGPSYQENFLRELAEFSQENACLGQVNYQKVSSFCGPEGLIFGYDILRVPLVPAFENDPNLQYGADTTFINMEPIVTAGRKFFCAKGTESRQFKPGTFLNAVIKRKISVRQSCFIASIGIVIPHNRIKKACLILEEVLTLSKEVPPSGAESLRLKHMKLFSRTCQQSAEVQNIPIKEILVTTVIREVPENNMGILQLVIPYFKFQQSICKGNQIPTDLIGLPFEQLEL